jgi:ankyrin repeat protein
LNITTQFIKESQMKKSLKEDKMSEILDQEIITAAEAGNLEGVTKALEAGANPSAMGPNSGALHCAAFNGHETIVALLLEKGAKLEEKDKQGYYPIHLSVSRGHVAITEQLLAAGANIEVLTPQNGTPLHIVAASNYPSILPVLINGGVNLEARDVNELTPLAAAASLGNVEIARLLIEAGADVNTKDVGADTPLIKTLRGLYGVRIGNWIYNEEEGDKTIRYEIIKGCFRRDGDYQFSKAKDSGTILSIEEQQNYLKKDWGPKDHLRYLEALYTAVLLIESGADVNAANDSRQTAIGMACHIGESKIIQKLYDKGANLDIKGYQNATPLHRAAGSGRLDGLEQLLSLGVSMDMNAVDDFGWTALHYLADIGGSPKMVHLLLEKGVDPKVKSTENRGTEMPLGSIAADIALHWKDEQLANALK